MAGDHDPSEVGATAVEYALMVAFIAIVILGAVALFGTSLGLSFQDSCDKMYPGNC